MDREALKAMIRGQEAAAARSRALRAAEGPPSPAESFERALELWELDPDLFSRPRTETELRGIAEVREAWRRLRERWRR